jgi:hypothetical protein
VVPPVLADSAGDEDFESDHMGGGCQYDADLFDHMVGLVTWGQIPSSWLVEKVGSGIGFVHVLESTLKST